MISVLIAAPNSQESHILKSAFRQQGFMTKIVSAEGATYLNIQKTVPNIIFVEMLKSDITQIKFIENVSTNKLLKSVPIICYGPALDRDTLGRYIQAGAKTYLARPLTLGILLESINELLKDKKQMAIEADKELNRAAYFDMLLNPRRLATQKIETMIKQVDRAKAFPFTISKIISLTEKDSTSIKELAIAISSDPTMAANTLKVSNSVFFRSKFRVNGKIKTIAEAIVRIGFEQTKKIAASLMIADIINKEENSFGFNREDFWFHSIATAIITEEIAAKCEIKDHSLAYLTGLLHDYGVVLYDDFLQEIFVLMLENTYTEHTTIEQSGKELIGLTHCDFTYELFESWNLPEELNASIRHHKNFQNITDSTISKDTHALCQIVGLANILAKCANIGRSCDEVVEPVIDKIMKKLWLQKGIEPSFFNSVYQQVSLYSQFLDLNERPMPCRSYICGPEENPFSIIIVNQDEKIFEPHLLYLECIGFNIMTFEKFGEFTDLVEERKADLVIINTSFKFDYTTHNKYITALDSKNIPRLVFAENEELASIPENEFTRALPKTIELNLILTAVDELFRQHKVDYFDLVEDSLPN